MAGLEDLLSPTSYLLIRIVPGMAGLEDLLSPISYLLPPDTDPPRVAGRA
jgi:hypothetical protein